MSPGLFVVPLASGEPIRMPNPLAYADPLAERGIVYDRWPRGVRITIRASCRWHRIVWVCVALTNPLLLLATLLGVGSAVCTPERSAACSAPR